MHTCEAIFRSYYIPRVTIRTKDKSLIRLTKEEYKVFKIIDGIIPDKTIIRIFTRLREDNINTYDKMLKTFINNILATPSKYMEF